MRLFNINSLFLLYYFYMFFIKFMCIYLSFIPNKSFTIPLKHFGTFFTTIVILSLSSINEQLSLDISIYLIFYNVYFHLQDSHINPTITIVVPMANSHPDNGSNSTSKIPSPIPIKHTPNVFFNAHNMLLYSPFSFYILYYLLFFFVTILCFYLVLLFMYDI